MVRHVDIAGVIFDMDGLVLDTERTYRIAWRGAARGLGLEFSEPFLEALTGLQSVDVGRALSAYCGAGFDLDTFNRLSAVCWREHVAMHGIEVKRGFTELLAVLVEQQVPYCLATNSAAANALECLRLAGLHGVFSTLVAREQVERGKPAPDIFLKAAEALQVPVSRCLVLEDSPTGIEAASRAGAVAVLVPSQPRVDPVTRGLCDFVFDDLAQVLALLHVD